MLKSKHQLAQAKIMQNTFDHETNVKTDLDNELVQCGWRVNREDVTK